MSYQIARKFWFFANDNGGQPRRRVEGAIGSVDDPASFRLTRAPADHEAQRRIDAILFRLWDATHGDEDG